MPEDLLPIGSVVLLCEGKKKLMVIGYNHISQSGFHDYYGVLFPEGYDRFEKWPIITFGQTAIKRIYLKAINNEEVMDTN